MTPVKNWKAKNINRAYLVKSLRKAHLKEFSSPILGSFFFLIQQKTKRQRPHKKVFQTLNKKHGRKRLRGKTHTSLYSAFTPSKSEN